MKFFLIVVLPLVLLAVGFAAHALWLQPEPPEQPCEPGKHHVEDVPGVCFGPM